MRNLLTEKIFLVLLASAMLLQSCNKEKKDPTPANPNTVVVGATSASIPARGDTLEIAVASNTLWTATADAAWVSLAPNVNNGNAILKIVCGANTGASARTATITLAATGATPAKITLSQEASNLLLSANSLVVPAEGDELKIAVTSNLAWTATSDSPSWLTTAVRNDSIIVMCDFSFDNTGRVGKITVKTGADTAILTVTQARGFDGSAKRDVMIGNSWMLWKYTKNGQDAMSEIDLCTRDDITSFSANDRYQVREGATACVAGRDVVKQGEWFLATSLVLILDMHRVDFVAFTDTSFSYVDDVSGNRYLSTYRRVR